MGKGSLLNWKMELQVLMVRWHVVSSCATASFTLRFAACTLSWPRPCRAYPPRTAKASKLLSPYESLRVSQRAIGTNFSSFFKTGRHRTVQGNSYLRWPSHLSFAYF